MTYQKFLRFLITPQISDPVTSVQPAFGSSAMGKAPGCRDSTEEHATTSYSKHLHSVGACDHIKSMNHRQGTEENQHIERIREGFV